MKYRTLIVDDEPISRRRLRRLVNAMSDLDVVAEAGDGRAAIAAVVEHKPDLMFLDIQMPEMDGFKTLQALDADVRPVVIFVTAFDEFALQAFEAQALDYVLKPIGPQRIHQAVKRSLVYLQGRNAAEFQTKVAGLLKSLPSVRSMTEPLLIKDGGKIVFVRPEEIQWIEAEGDYMKVHTASETHFLRATMGEMEERLAKNGFVRIHRSHLVNIDQVKELRSSSQGESVVVVLKSGERLTGSRNLLRSFQQRFERLAH